MIVLLLPIILLFVIFVLLFCREVHLDQKRKIEKELLDDARLLIDFAAFLATRGVVPKN